MYIMVVTLDSLAISRPLFVTALQLSLAGSHRYSWHGPASGQSSQSLEQCFLHNAARRVLRFGLYAVDFAKMQVPRALDVTASWFLGNLETLSQWNASRIASGNASCP